MDYSQYHPDWRDVIRPAILKRDGYKCAHCGVKHKSRVYKDTTNKYVECDDFMEQWATSTGRKVFTLFLQVAHRDHNKQNNDPSNLLSLCPVHHARFDTEHKRLARIMYKQKVVKAGSKLSSEKKLDRGFLLQTLQSSIRKHIGSKISLVDSEAILHELLTAYDNMKKQ
jgi:5-methylcytosine-specific restriction endonuclease McrA